MNGRGHRLLAAILGDEQRAVHAREHAVVHHVAQRHAANRGQLRASDVIGRLCEPSRALQPGCSDGDDTEEREGD